MCYKSPVPDDATVSDDTPVPDDTQLPSDAPVPDDATVPDAERIQSERRAPERLVFSQEIGGTSSSTQICRKLTSQQVLKRQSTEFTEWRAAIDKEIYSLKTKHGILFNYL